GEVVLDGVLDEVLDQPFEKEGIARDDTGLKTGFESDAGPFRDGSQFRGDVTGDLSEIDGLDIGGSLLAAREGEKTVDQLLVPLVDRKERRPELPDLLIGSGLQQGDLDQSPGDGERRAQLMARVGDEAAL